MIKRIPATLVATTILIFPTVVPAAAVDTQLGFKTCTISVSQEEQREAGVDMKIGTRTLSREEARIKLDQARELKRRFGGLSPSIREAIRREPANSARARKLREELVLSERRMELLSEIEDELSVCVFAGNTLGSGENAVTPLVDANGQPTPLGQGVLVVGGLLAVVGLAAALLPVFSPILKQQFGIDLPTVESLLAPVAPNLPPEVRAALHI